MASPVLFSETPVFHDAVNEKTGWIKPEAES